MITDNIQITKSNKFPEFFEISMQNLRDNSCEFSIKEFSGVMGAGIPMSTVYTFDNFYFSIGETIKLHGNTYIIHHFDDDIIYLELISCPVN